VLEVQPTTREQCLPRVRGGHSPRAFTLVDVLVSITVIAILIGLLLPSLAKVNETARRVACQSNIRQVGLGVVMYADDWNGQLLPSRFLPTGMTARVNQAPEQMVTIRIDEPLFGGPATWDGLGILYSAGYLSAPKIFYCPSHRGDNPYSKYAPIWNELNGEVVANYHFRGEGPTRSSALGTSRVTAAPTTRNLYMIDPAQSSLIADGMRQRSDYNHLVGVNFFRADLTVHWFHDRTQRLAEILPETKEDADRAIVDEAWGMFDTAANLQAR
jgi:competence protein ComGC